MFKIRCIRNPKFLPHMHATNNRDLELQCWTYLLSLSPTMSIPANPKLPLRFVLLAALSTFCELSQIRIWGCWGLRHSRAIRPSLPLSHFTDYTDRAGGRVIDARRSSNGRRAPRRGGELRVSDFEVGARGVIIPTWFSIQQYVFARSLHFVSNSMSICDIFCLKMTYHDLTPQLTSCLKPKTLFYSVFPLQVVGSSSTAQRDS